MTNEEYQKALEAHAAALMGDVVKKLDERNAKLFAELEEGRKANKALKTQVANLEQRLQKIDTDLQREVPNNIPPPFAGFSAPSTPQFYD